MSAGLAVAGKLFESRLSGVSLASVAHSFLVLVLVLDPSPVAGGVIAARDRYSAPGVDAVGSRRED